VGEADVTRVAQAVAEFAGDDALIVLSGSLPPGCDPIVYAEMTATLTAGGARVLLDTSGAPLTHALRADVLPQIVKPNRRELAAWADTPLDTMADVVACATALHRRG
ncbi:PfkB family carbohydrate kinase, partial [Escherichia coli]|nr:PfkB family carbohydrate kinase [Escherichia coli]